MENFVKWFRILALIFACLHSSLCKNLHELILIFEQYQGEIPQNIYETKIDFRIISCQIISQSL